MTSEVEFLREKAAVLRALAHRAPTIADALRRLADELESEAADLEGRHDRPSADSRP
jgi:hypothetical protein